jgi:uncharacterized protein (TIGR03435 family)
MRYGFRSRVAFLIAVVALFPCAARAQAAGNAATAFSVSTVKPSLPSRHSSMGYSSDSFIVRSMTLREIVKYAYDLGNDHQLAGEPAWVDTTPFDVVAKEEESMRQKLDSLPLDQHIALSRTLLQPLLAERFRLRAHYETRTISVLLLTAAKSHRELKLSAPPDPASKEWSGLHNNNGHAEGRAASIEMLDSYLATQPEIGGRMVVNRTGLIGEYDFALDWVPQRNMTTADQPGTSLFTALEEQLGLKLKSGKAPVRVLVIDHVEMPTPN